MFLGRYWILTFSAQSVQCNLLSQRVVLLMYNELSAWVLWDSPNNLHIRWIRKAQSLTHRFHSNVCCHLQFSPRHTVTHSIRFYLYSIFFLFSSVATEEVSIKYVWRTPNSIKLLISWKFKALINLVWRISLIVN